jgi:phosphoribosylglycinamide formyltransferase-1
MKRLVIFASGSGTNAANIISYFQKSGVTRVTLVLSNKKDAKVLERAHDLGVASRFFTKEELYDTQGILPLLKEHRPDLIVLAGFLLKFPSHILQEFPGKVVNIHPALLPKYGGKGMYGAFVHQAVIENRELESGITVHLVNDAYDEGAILFQKSTPLSANETPDSLAAKIHELEYEYFPKVLEQLLLSEDSTKP